MQLSKWQTEDNGSLSTKMQSNYETEIDWSDIQGYINYAA